MNQQPTFVAVESVTTSPRAPIAPAPVTPIDVKTPGPANPYGPGTDAQVPPGGPAAGVLAKK